ncbi:hypothetical protein AA13595_2119 [Gluconacetobacter johannae DSM 13595]|nr:hypothetical protein [Gluconacetobacter johannae]GBQ87267.1 hypothetical protein AA13595_2119 [Gluconacetobacter johannae DSM 13595]
MDPSAPGEGQLFRDREERVVAVRRLSMPARGAWDGKEAVVAGCGATQDVGVRKCPLRITMAERAQERQEIA